MVFINNGCDMFENLNLEEFCLHCCALHLSIILVEPNDILDLKSQKHVAGGSVTKCKLCSVDVLNGSV